MKLETKQKIKELVSNVIINKLNNYSSETEYRPFYEALFEKQVIAQASIVILNEIKISNHFCDVTMTIF